MLLTMRLSFDALAAPTREWVMADPVFFNFPGRRLLRIMRDLDLFDAGFSGHVDWQILCRCDLLSFSWGQGFAIGTLHGLAYPRGREAVLPLGPRTHLPPRVSRSLSGLPRAYGG